MSTTFHLTPTNSFCRMKFDFNTLQEEDSPYPEVRASVSNIDDPDMPALTIRMWVIGLFLSTLGRYVSPSFCAFPVVSYGFPLLFRNCSAMNIFFNFRQPAPFVFPIVLLLIAHPLGKYLAYSLPFTIYHLPSFLGGAR